MVGNGTCGHSAVRPPEALVPSTEDMQVVVVGGDGQLWAPGKEKPHVQQGHCGGEGPADFSAPGLLA